jgi:hypothetical protein
MSSQQYFTLGKLKELMPSVDLKSIKLLSTDSYSDQEVWENLEKTGDVKTLAVCALQTAIIGSGNKNFGTFSYKGAEMSVEDVYKKKGVIMNFSSGEKLQPGDLTPRRLHRAFRLLIRNYLEQSTDNASYLWRKYSSRDERYRTICYPGSEHLIEDSAEGCYLYHVYRELDSRKDTNIAERIRRVLEARGLKIE